MLAKEVNLKVEKYCRKILSIFFKTLPLSQLAKKNGGELFQKKITTTYYL